MTNQDIVNAARDLAQEKHAGQVRKGSVREPYFEHVADVARILENVAGIKDPSIIAAAYLHDLIEDSDETEATLAERFGGDVANLVAQLTDQPGLAEADRWRAQIEHAVTLSPRAKLIKTADKISNLSEMFRDPPPAWNTAKKLAYLEWGEAVFMHTKGQSDPLDALFIETAAALRTALLRERDAG